MQLFVVWVIFHSNAMHLIEPEGKERSGSLFLGAGSLVSNKSTVVLALQNFHTGAGKGVSSAVPIPCGLCHLLGSRLLGDLPGRWPWGCLVLWSCTGKGHVWKFPQRTLNLSAGLLEVLSNRSLHAIFVTLEVVLTIPFINFFSEINSSISLDLSFFSHKYVHHNYGLSYESLKSFCCGNIFVNSTPVHSVFLFI